MCTRIQSQSKCCCHKKERCCCYFNAFCISNYQRTPQILIHIDDSIIFKENCLRVVFWPHCIAHYHVACVTFNSAKKSDKKGPDIFPSIILIKNMRLNFPLLIKSYFYRISIILILFNWSNNVQKKLFKRMIPRFKSYLEDIEGFV